LSYHRFLLNLRAAGEDDVKKTGTAGIREADVRSDCHVSLEITSGKGLKINLQSRVAALYGDEIKALSLNVLEFFGIESARLTVEDAGALPFVIAARIEAAVRQCVETDKEYLPAMLSQNTAPTAKDRPRRSRLYLPGNTPKLFTNAGLHGPDAVILDLEDSVAPDRKDEARVLVRNALRAVDFYGAERMVRINQLPRGLDDLESVVPQFPNVILVPKCESADDVRVVNEKIELVKRERGLDHPVWLMPIIESARGVLNAPAVAAAADNVSSLAIGLEDYTADIGTQRTNEGRETYFARSMIVTAARAAGIQPIDSVFSDVDDMEALRAFVLDSKGLGFEGMGCIHPRQIPVIHEAYAPGEAEIGKARRIVEAFHAAEEKGLGVVSLGSKMIDPPVVKRALRTIEQAVASGKLPADWRKLP
jgi:citrate lyase subunit beta/citryl-CoA lyase